MKIFVAGATGRVGGELVSDLVQAGHEVVAASRHALDVDWIAGVIPCEFDFHSDESEMTQAIEGCDAICFVAGSRGKDLLQTDAFGAVKLMRAAKECGIERFVMLSSLFAMQPERWAQEPSLQSILDYNIAKFFADEYLSNISGLKWTIVQPSMLTEEPGSGLVELNPDRGGANPIPDVAAVLAGVIERPNTIGKVIMMISGSQPIDAALAEI